MDLVGAWLRQLLRAGTAAAIVPVALLAALLVIALGSGGLGGLGSLGQLVAGPALSDSDAAGPSVTEDPRAAPVAPGTGDAAPARGIASNGGTAGGRVPAPRPRAPQQGPGAKIAPAGPGSSIGIAPPGPATPPAPFAPPSSPPPSGQQRPPQLTEVLSTTVNAVVVGVQTLIEQLVQALGLAPPPTP